MAASRGDGTPPEVESREAVDAGPAPGEAVPTDGEDVGDARSVHYVSDPPTDRGDVDSHADDEDGDGGPPKGDPRSSDDVGADRCRCSVAGSQEADILRADEAEGSAILGHGVYEVAVGDIVPATDDRDVPVGDVAKDGRPVDTGMVDDCDHMVMSGGAGTYGRTRGRGSTRSPGTKPAPYRQFCRKTPIPHPTKPLTLNRSNPKRKTKNEERRTLVVHLFRWKAETREPKAETLHGPQSPTPHPQSREVQFCAR